VEDPARDAPVTRLVPMPADVHAAWRGSAPPPPDGDHELEALEIEVGDVVVGGVLLDHAEPAGVRRTTIRLLETSLDPDDRVHWPVVLAALEDHLARRGTTTVVTAVGPALLARFQEAGYAATMTGVGVTLAGRAERLVDDVGRVVLRPMGADERRRWVPDARDFLRGGMVRAGVLVHPDAPMAQVDRRLDAILADPPPQEVLLTATADGTPVGRFWGTVVPGPDGRHDLVANTLDLLPEHRGRGLMRPFLAAVETYAREHGHHDVRARVYALAGQARATLLGVGLGLDDVHLRKDLPH
jgi:GNAT superfamily N-acetyltransferase